MKKYISRILAIGFFCFVAGVSSELVGETSPPIIYTTWDILKFLATIAALLLIGFIAGLEQGEE